MFLLLLLLGPPVAVDHAKGVTGVLIATGVTA
jgi:hypothetical protein